MTATLTAEQSRMATGFGVGALASCAFHFFNGDNFQLLQIEGKGLIVLLAVGVAAIVGGLLRNALICLTAGVVLLAAAVVALITLGGSRWLGGNASTFAVFLGFGVGLVGIALVALLPSRGATDTQRPTASAPTAQARTRRTREP